MKTYLLDLFRYNDWANRLMLEALGSVEDTREARRLYTHVALCQYGWLKRVRGEDTHGWLWFADPYDLPTCEREWTNSLKTWLGYLNGIAEADLAQEITYVSSEGPMYRSTVQEIAVQLNHHSVHHRAQVAQLIRQQGYAPPATDYIFFTRRTENKVQPA